MNTKHLLLLLTILASSLAISQERTYYGSIVDDYNVKLHSVDIYINNIKTTTSKCKGRFKVKAQMGDTIRFEKIGYVSFEMILKRKRRVKVELVYNYIEISNLLISYNKETFNPKNIQHTGQPLFIVDGVPFTPDYYTFKGKRNLNFLGEHNVEDAKILKGQKALDLLNALTVDNIQEVKALGGIEAEIFGKEVRNGIVLITTNCNYNAE